MARRLAIRPDKRDRHNTFKGVGQAAEKRSLRAFHRYHMARVSLSEVGRRCIRRSWQGYQQTLLKSAKHDGRRRQKQ